jgi:hypothetical protein
MEIVIILRYLHSFVIYYKVVILSFFSVCTGLETIFRVITKTIGWWGNWKHKYGTHKNLSKKKAFMLFTILFISYNNFIINYKRVTAVINTNTHIYKMKRKKKDRKKWKQIINK